MRWILGLVVLSLCACRARAVDATLPLPAAPRDDEASCGGCHSAEVDEWRTSMHHASYSSADFQRSYRAEPRTYCVDCHAPLRDAASGIGCTACHEGDFTAGSEKHPHVTTKTKACKSCHDFDVPSTQAILQSTAREHSASSFAATPCEQCHMQPRGERGLRRDHRFSVSRNPELLGRSVRVYSARIEDGAVVVLLASQGVGHRFPTGDIFRRLTITLTALNKDDAVIAGDTFHLSRDWDGHRASLRAGQPETIGGDGDTRLTDAPREFRIVCPKDPARVHVTVQYERGAGAVANDELFDLFESTEILDTDVSFTQR